MSKESNDPHEWLTISEAATMIGISDQTLRRYVEEGYLKCIVLPSGHRRFKKSDIESLIKSMTSGNGKKEVDKNTNIQPITDGSR